MIHKITALIGCTFSLSSAFAAAPTADLQIKGQLAVPMCSVAAANNGTYDLGKHSATVIKPNADTPLPKMSQTWTITCDAETYLNMAHLDNRAFSTSAVSSTGGTNFGLGSVNGTGKIGFYKVVLEHGSIDGSNAYFFVSNNNSIASNNHLAAINLYDGWRTGWANPASLVQKSGKVFVADISIIPTLASSKTMQGPIADDTDIDGSLTLTFAYGL